MPLSAVKSPWSRVIFLTIFIWFAFCISLSAWWMIFGLRQLEALKRLDPVESADLVAKQQMLLYEGSTLFIALLLGALALFFMVRRILLQNRSIRELFATFTHELKTPLASLRLQIDSLESDLPVDASSRLQADLSRLSLRIENALAFSEGKRRALFQEELKISEIVERSALSYPSLEISISGVDKVVGDRQALDSVFLNLLSNSFLHGKADKVEITSRNADGWLAISVRDNGKGVAGDARGIGKAFSRVDSRSGSGIGLFTVKNMIEAHGGQFSAGNSTSGRGFEVMIRLRSEDK